MPPLIEFQLTFYVIPDSLVSDFNQPHHETGEVDPLRERSQLQF